MKNRKYYRRLTKTQIEWLKEAYLSIPRDTLCEVLGITPTMLENEIDKIRNVDKRDFLLNNSGKWR